MNRSVNRIGIGRDTQYDLKELGGERCPLCGDLREAMQGARTGMILSDSDGREFIEAAREECSKAPRSTEYIPTVYALLSLGLPVRARSSETPLERLGMHVTSNPGFGHSPRNLKDKRSYNQHL